MTQPKILTPQEALRALADGKKLTHADWGEKEFIEFVAGRFVDELGSDIDVTPVTNFIEYTEPKPKRKVAPYIVRGDKKVWMTGNFYETDADLWIWLAV